MIPSHLAFIHEVHLNELYHLFSYLKKNHNYDIIFGPSDSVIDEAPFDFRDWSTSEFGITAKDYTPGNMPESCRFEFVMSAFVNFDQCWVLHHPKFTH